MGLNPLVDKIRAKYPGAYDDMDDASLTKAILAKHPEYEDLAAPAANLGKIPIPAMEQSTLGALEAGPTGTAPGENLPSPKAQMARDTTPSPAVGAVTLVGAGGTAIAPLADAALANPAVRGVAIELGKEGLKQAATGGTLYTLFKLFK